MVEMSGEVGGAAHAARSDPPAVEQYQNALHAQAAQIDLRSARAVVHDEGRKGAVNLGARCLGCALQQCRRVNQTQFAGNLAIDDLDRRCAGELVAPDSGAGHDDFVHDVFFGYRRGVFFLGVFRLFFRGLCEGRITERH